MLTPKLRIIATRAVRFGHLAIVKATAEVQRNRRRVHVAHFAGCDACRVGRKRLGSIAPKHPIRPRWLGGHTRRTQR